MNTKVVGALAGLGLLALTILWVSRENHVAAPRDDALAAREETIQRSGGLRKPFGSRRHVDNPESSSTTIHAERHLRGNAPAAPQSTGPGAIAPRRIVVPRATHSVSGPANGTADGQTSTEEDDFDALKTRALTDADPEERISALSELDTLNDERALPVVIAALGDPDRQVRLAALDELTLVSAGAEPPLDVLGSLLNDPDPQVRLEALKMIGDSEDERAKDIARKALSDTDEEVRTEAEDIVSLDDDE